MAIENATYIHQLDPTLPGENDQVVEGDNHIKLTKQVLKATFPEIRAPVTAEHSHLNNVLLSVVELTDIKTDPDPSKWTLHAIGPDRIPYYDTANSAKCTPFTAFGRSIVGSADAASVVSKLGTDTRYP